MRTKILLHSCYVCFYNILIHLLLQLVLSAYLEISLSSAISLVDLIGDHACGSGYDPLYKSKPPILITAQISDLYSQRTKRIG